MVHSSPLCLFFLNRLNIRPFLSSSQRHRNPLSFLFLLHCVSISFIVRPGLSIEFLQNVRLPSSFNSSPNFLRHIANEMVHDRFSHLKSPLWLDSDASADEISPRLRESGSNTDLSQGSLGTEADSPQEEDKSSGVQRPSGVKSDKEKKKRTRVTPEQLIHLERYFAMDRNPTAARRKDISELLGMQERQTQIWFQNRLVHPPLVFFVYF